MTFSWEFPYPSQRMPVFARNVVAASQALAAHAGLKMMLTGGNAVGAVLATAITLTVVEPTSKRHRKRCFRPCLGRGKATWIQQVRSFAKGVVTRTFFRIKST